MLRVIFWVIVRWSRRCSMWGGTWRTTGLTSGESWQNIFFCMDSKRPGTTTIKCRSRIVPWFMCHTLYLARFPDDLGGGQVHGGRGRPQQVAHQGSNWDMECGTSIKAQYLTGIQWWWSQASRSPQEDFFFVQTDPRSGRPPQALEVKKNYLTPWG